eukprot:TRINITY_DN69345_c0_g1_i1.p1 TRINITY_DN69345_c0_g1~~TRINITY_DN69345_c0_g1_i1.p1  ORF type:complete len:128 (+),score=18.43 TRINITY_DN69345_c0_g1_i1:157-540(+)
MKGITKTIVGYTGGKTKRPTYETVCGGDGHTEAIRIWFDPSVLSYEELVSAVLDASLLIKNKPGARPAETDQYRHVIWYHNKEQQAVASRLVVAPYSKWMSLEPVKPWYNAEDYHQKYYDKNGCCVM